MSKVEYMITCKNNGAFEDQMKEGVDYVLHEVRGNSVEITNELGQRRWYGKGAFELDFIAPTE